MKLKPAVTTALEVVALALVTVGVALIYLPAGFIVAGVGLFLLSYLIERSRR
jgi:hypothetical protein